jgi:hypothetical protein
MDTGIRIQSFVFKVIERLFSKFSRLFLYSFVDLNHKLKRSEPLAKQKEAKSRKGVVGRRGRTTPTAPIPQKRNPNAIKRYFTSIHLLNILKCIKWLMAESGCISRSLGLKKPLFPELFSHSRIVAMCFAIIAKGFCFLKG